MKKMSEKQIRFADYYVELGNATEAAIKAGYSSKTARAIGAENLTKPNISQYIEKRLEALASERIADQQEILETLTRILRRENKEMETVIVKKAETIELQLASGKTTEKQVYNEYVETVQLDTKNSDVNKAAELLGKRYAMWTEKQQIENITPVFKEDVPEDDD
ncbi:terminase small subunit [Alkalicoccus luteus]|uniref:Terminase small subunit n=1 Tax=Alkalicoccus luteus TaxID=1237094 RepID=A0A969TTQ9_9BACI|nr:terminase small subunit [Alkalicoccus luteus]NJP37913.1 terminase small subunit [Alkalicoccus luteus]